MFGIDEIKRMNKEAAKKAKGKKPYVAEKDGENVCGLVPNFGDYRPKGWSLIESLFVDNSGFGSPGESALTANQFIEKVKKGLGYAIIEQGQFQIYIGVFRKRKTRKTKGKKCKSCGRYGVDNKVVDIDGTNLVEAEICRFCKAGSPALR